MAFGESSLRSDGRKCACLAPAVGGQASVNGLVAAVGRGRVGRERTMQTADLYDLNAERLQPGQESLQGGLILQWAVQDRLNRLD